MKKYFLCILVLSFSSFAFSAPKITIPSNISLNDTLHKLIEIEDHRMADDLFLVAALNHSSQQVIKQALTSIGRIGKASHADLVAPLLKHKSSQVRSAAAVALGLLVTDASSVALREHLNSETEPKVRGNSFKSLGQLGSPESIQTFEEALLSDTDLYTKGFAAQGLGILLTFGATEYQASEAVIAALLSLSIKRGPKAEQAAFALSRMKAGNANMSIDGVINAIDAAKSLRAKALLCRILGRYPGEQARIALGKLLTDGRGEGVKVEAARALSKQTPANKVIKSLLVGLKDDSSQVVIQSLSSLASFGDLAKNAAPNVEHLAVMHESLWIKAESLKVLAGLSTTAATPLIEAALESTESLLVAAGIASLGSLGRPEDINRLLSFLTCEKLNEAVAAAGALGEIQGEQVSVQMKDAYAVALAKNDIALSYYATEFAKKFKVLKLAEPLANAYGAFTRPDEVEAKVAILEALAIVGNSNQLAVIKLALKDPVKQVVAAAAKAILAITGEDVSDQIPDNTAVESDTPTMLEMSRAVRSVVVLKTSKGIIALKMSKAAPLNAANFIKLAESGFYTNKPFHRIVPNFVAQGGDPRGDGFGGPGYFIRDEVSNLSHLRGTVGVATAGKDTGGCQFFINHAPNFHLDGRYTVFAKVVFGMKTADKLEAGDQILSVKVRN